MGKLAELLIMWIFIFIPQITLTYVSRVLTFVVYWGWSGGAMVLGKLTVPGRPTCLD